MLNGVLGRVHTHLGLYLGLVSNVRSRPVGLAVSMAQRAAGQIERVVLRVKPKWAFYDD
jgi:hypothetical protein